ncbi:MAG: hypothetical protein GXO07_03310, partial [Crenarchaeota archaeon]|nr:hypothetical protein [Thermoproteota archaeon]
MAQRSKRGGIGLIIGAVILLLVMLVALSTITQILSRMAEIRMEGVAGGGAEKAYAASLLSVGLCACTSNNINVNGLSQPYVALIYKGNVKLPSEPLLAVVISLNVSYADGTNSLAEVVLSPANPAKAVALGGGAVAAFALKLPIGEAQNPPISQLAQAAEEQGWEVYVGSNSTGLYAIGLIQATFENAENIKDVYVRDVRLITPNAEVSLTRCRFAVANMTGALDIGQIQLEGGISTSQCNCTCRVKGFPLTQWISLAALMTNEKCPAPPDDRTAVFFIPFEVRSEVPRGDFPVVVPINATRLAMMDGADGKSFPVNYLKLAYNGDPNLEQRINFFVNTCGLGGQKCAYIYGIIPWVQNPRTGDKVVTHWSFTPSIATLSEVEYGTDSYPTGFGTVTSFVHSLTFASPYLPYTIKLFDSDGNMVPEVYFCSGSECTMVYKGPFFLSDHWGLLGGNVTFPTSVSLYSVASEPPVPDSPDYLPPGAVEYSTQSLNIKP